MVETRVFKLCLRLFVNAVLVSGEINDVTCWEQGSMNAQNLRIIGSDFPHPSFSFFQSLARADKFVSGRVM